MAPDNANQPTLQAPTDPRRLPPVANSSTKRRGSRTKVLPPLQMEMPEALVVTDAEIDLVLGTLGATIARILRDDA